MEDRITRREFLKKFGAAGLMLGALPMGGTLEAVEKILSGRQQADTDDKGTQAAAIEVSDKAKAVHAKAIIIDGHNDSFVLRLYNKDSSDLTVDRPEYHVDLPRMRAGGLTAMNTYTGGDRPLEWFVELWGIIRALVAQYPQHFMVIEKTDDIVRCKRENKVGFIMQLEGCRCLTSSLLVLQSMHRMGMRVAGLTHGSGGAEHCLQAQKSPFGFCTLADRDEVRKQYPGLTDFGRQAVPEMNRLGVVVDLAHCQDAAYFEAIELSTSPVEFSHGNVFGVSPSWRNLTDDQLKALAANRGVIGLATCPGFVERDYGKRSMNRFVDHIEYICELVGDDHVGFGADYDGMGSVPIVKSHAEMPQVTQIMLDRGFSEETILKFWGGNFLRVMREVEAAATG